MKKISLLGATAALALIPFAGLSAASASHGSPSHEAGDDHGQHQGQHQGRHHRHHGEAEPGHHQGRHHGGHGGHDDGPNHQ